MPYINVILKDGTRIPVPDATSAGWAVETRADGASRESSNLILRLVVKNGDAVVARFNNEDTAGYVWVDGKPGAAW